VRLVLSQLRAAALIAVVAGLAAGGSAHADDRQTVPPGTAASCVAGKYGPAPPVCKATDLPYPYANTCDAQYAQHFHRKRGWQFPAIKPNLPYQDMWSAYHWHRLNRAAAKLKHNPFTVKQTAGCNHLAVGEIIYTITLAKGYVGGQLGIRSVSGGLISCEFDGRRDPMREDANGFVRYRTFRKVVCRTLGAGSSGIKGPWEAFAIQLGARRHK
jgi:hypothetical protein